VDGAETKRAVVQHLASGVAYCSPGPHQAKRLAKQLTAAGIPAVGLHGNLSQNARERNLEAFSRAGYFTLKVRHAVLAAVCAVVLAIVARMR